MKHHASPSFWECVDKLPDQVQRLARKNYELLKVDPKRPSLHFKMLGKYFSVRVGRQYRALGVEVEDGLLWFWIGSHSEYDRLLG